MCPMKSGYMECGYYVLWYMKDIIDAQGIHPRDLFEDDEEYRKEFMDEVRVELMNYIRDHLCTREYSFGDDPLISQKLQFLS